MSKSGTYDPSVERHFVGHKDQISGLCFHPETSHIGSSSLDRTLMVWNFTDSVRAYKFSAHKDVVLDVDYAPSGEVIATASKDRSVRIWVPKIHGESLDFRAHSGAVRSVKFSSDGENVIFRNSFIFNVYEILYILNYKWKFEKRNLIQQLVTSSDDKSVKIWKVCRRRFLQSFTDHTNWVRCAKYSQDGRLIVSCSDDKTIKLWDTVSGQCVRTFNEIKGNF